MNSPFLEAAKGGQNGWLRYLVGTVLVVFLPIVVFLVGAIALAILLVIAAILNPTIGSWVKNLSRAQVPSLVQIQVYGFPILALVVTTAFAALALLTLVGVMERLHQRRFLSLLGTGREALSFKRLAQGFILWFGLTALLFGVWFLRFSSLYRPSFQLQEWVISLPLSALFAGVRSLYVGLLVYGYWLQGAGLLIRNPVQLVLGFGAISGLIEVLYSEPTWIDRLLNGVFALASTSFLTALVLRDNRLELALGGLFAQTLFPMVIVQRTDAEIMFPTVLKRVSLVETPEIWGWRFGVMLIQFAVFWRVFFDWMPRRSQALK
jgi:uncharacterized protein